MGYIRTEHGTMIWGYIYGRPRVEEHKGKPFIVFLLRHTRDRKTKVWEEMRCGAWDRDIIDAIVAVGTKPVLVLGMEEVERGKRLGSDGKMHIVPVPVLYVDMLFEFNPAVKMVFGEQYDRNIPKELDF